MSKFLVVFHILLMTQSYVLGQDLFEQAFGKKQTTRNISLPLVFEKSSLGEVTFFVQGNSIVSVDSHQLVSVLSKVVDDKILKQVKLDKELSVLNLPKEIELNLKLESLYVEFLIAPKYFKKNKVKHSLMPNIVGRKVFYPEKYSHILNYWLDYRKLESRNDTYNLDLDSSLNIHDYVLENKLLWSKDNEINNLYRRRTTLVKDFEKKSTRLQMGDIFFNTANLQSQLTLLGFSYAKDYSLSPYTRITPINSFEFVLERRSYVTVYVNERPIRSEILDKGKHSIEDIVLDYGRNNIKISVNEIGGDTKEFTYTWASGNRLLRSGLSQYSLNIGTPSNYVSNKLEYDSSRELVFSGFYNRGITNWLTAGLSSQINRDDKTLGPSFFMALPHGNFRLESMYSDHKLSNRRGIISEAEYDFTQNFKKGDLRHALLFKYTSPGFRNFKSTRLSDNEYLKKLEYDFNWYFNEYLNFNFDISREFSRYQDGYDRDLYGLGFSLKPERGVRLTTNYQRRKITANEWSKEITIFVNFSSFETGHYLNTYHDTENNRHLAQFNYLPSKKQDSFYYRTEVEKDKDIRRTRLTSGYKSRYFNSEASYQAKDESKPDLYARLSGGIVMAPNFISFSPTVYNSFTYIRGKNSLYRKKLGILTDVGGMGSKEFQTQVMIPNLSPYHYYQVQMDPTHLEYGSSFDYDRFFIYPTNKSVIGVELGKTKTFTILGEFGKINSLQVGEFVGVGGSYFPFFTNREGKFVVENIPVGKYELWLNGKKVKNKIIVSNKDQTIIDLGKVKR